MTTLTHGEIISWEIASGTVIAVEALRDAVKAAGLDEAVVRDMAPRNAFARACHRLTERRVIRKLFDGAGLLTFQFTREVEGTDGGAKRYSYDFEAVLTLDKATGAVTCDANPELAATATEMVKAEAGRRYSSDVTDVIQAIMDRQADLFQIRSQGGCYFVPARFAAILDQLDVLLTRVGGSLRRFPVAAGSAAGDRSVRESVEDGLATVVRDHRRAVEEFDETTRDGTLKKMVERINLTRFKVEAYAEYLSDRRAALDAQLAAARQALRDKVAQLGRKTDVPEPAPAAAPQTVAVHAGPWPMDDGEAGRRHLQLREAA